MRKGPRSHESGSKSSRPRYTQLEFLKSQAHQIPWLDSVWKENRSKSLEDGREEMVISTRGSGLVDREPRSSAGDDQRSDELSKVLDELQLRDHGSERLMVKSEILKYHPHSKACIE